MITVVAPLLLRISVYQGDDPPPLLADTTMIASAPTPPTLPISNPQNSGANPDLNPSLPPRFISRISSPIAGSSSFYLADGFEVILIETLGALVLLTVLVIFLTFIGSLFISTLMVGAAIVAVHGAFCMPEDLFLDIQELAMAYRSEYDPSQPLNGVHISGSLHMTIQTMIAYLTDLPNAPRLLSSLAPSIFPANSAACHPAAIDYSPFRNAG